MRTERDAVSDLWKTRTRGGRIACNERHADLAPMIAEALDVLAANEWDGHAAAEVLGVSTSQLVKLLAKHHPALQRWNDERTALGLRPLKA